MAGPTQFGVFLAAPSDVGSDVETAKFCIEEINLLAAPLGMRFGTFFWADDAVPGIDLEPQALINEQSEGYDVFIAIFGAKIGSPTAHHESGTVEEVERAISSISTLAFGKYSIMIFFKSIKLDTRHADLSAAVKVQQFRETLGPRGILFKDFDSDQTLREALFRSFGVLIASRLRASSSTLVLQAATSTAVVPEDLPGDELGLLDLEAIALENMEGANRYAERVGEIISNLGDRVSSSGEAIDAAGAGENRSLLRKLINDVAVILKESAVELDEAAESLLEYYQSAFSAFENMLDIQTIDFGGGDSEERRKFLEAIESIGKTTLETNTQISGLYNSVSGLPRMTKDLNVSKRSLLLSIEKLMTNLAIIQSENRDFLNRFS